MNKTAPKILVILGPTATGKSALAVALAHIFNGEIISADSRQVYRGLNLGTGKITSDEMRGVPHHLLDIADPKHQASVTEYQALAREKISEIFSRGKLPIICGGTGFYIDALVNDTTFPDVPADLKLRAKLKTETLEKLFAQLITLDPVRAKIIDSKNPVRLIRAIEIATKLGAVPQHVATSPYHALKIGLTLSPDTLRLKINARLTTRLASGMLAEARRLHVHGLTWKRMEELGLEYRFLARHLAKKLSKSKMISALQTEIWRYSKRQMTWFRRDKEIRWFSPDEQRKIEMIVAEFLRS